MFTGIIEELGTLVELHDVGTSLCLKIEAERVFRGVGYSSDMSGEIPLNGLKIDDSIAINGVCLTVTSANPPFFEVIAVRETLQKTTLGSLIAGVGRGYQVNLERAATLQTRLGGHLVSGHVDGKARIREIRDLDGSWEFHFELPAVGARYAIPMGSIAIEGVSLTVAEIEANRIKIAIIPHTYYHTTFQNLHVGSEVNVEFDQIAKMVEKLMSVRASHP